MNTNKKEYLVNIPIVVEAASKKEARKIVQDRLRLTNKGHKIFFTFSRVDLGQKGSKYLED